MNDLDDELCALQEENARLREDLALLRPPPPPPPTLSGPRQTPNTRQISQLVDIVLSRYGCLRRPEDRAIDDDRFLYAVQTSLRFLGVTHRLPEGEVDSRYEERWKNRCQDWITSNGLGAQVDPYMPQTLLAIADEVIE